MRWKILAIIYLVILGLIAISERHISLVDAISEISIIWCLVGSYGFAFNQNIGKQAYWRLMLGYTVVYNLLYIFILDKKFGAQPGSVGTDIVGFLICAPVLYMTYRYAFQRPTKKHEVVRNGNGKKASAERTSIVDSLAKNASIKKSSQAPRRKRYLVPAIVVLILLTAVLWNPIANKVTIASADPAMLQLAKNANMSIQGELLFLRTQPRLDSQSQFIQDCSTANANNNGTSILGCYDPQSNRIYLLRMPSTLYNVEVTTAAYEMLHPVYTSLSETGDATKLNQAIESNYKAQAADQDLVGQITMFAKTEPGARDLELFSLLGTQYGNVSSDLSSYYAPYFNDNLDAVVADNQQVQSVFTSDLNQLNTLQDQYNQDVSAANKANKNADTAYYDSTTWADAGNAYENNYNYNIYVQDLNAYNEDVDLINNNVDAYNRLLDQYNTLVTAYSGNQPISQLQTDQ